MEWLALTDYEKLDRPLKSDPSLAQCTLYEGLRRNQKYSGNWSIIETNYKGFLIAYSVTEKKSESVYVFTRDPEASDLDKKTINNILVANFGTNYSQDLNMNRVY